MARAQVMADDSEAIDTDVIAPQVTAATKRSGEFAMQTYESRHGITCPHKCTQYGISQLEGKQAYDVAQRQRADSHLIDRCRKAYARRKHCPARSLQSGVSFQDALSPVRRAHTDPSVAHLLVVHHRIVSLGVQP
jgi:hypothetical protein